MSARNQEDPSPERLRVNFLVKWDTSPELMTWLRSLPHQGRSSLVRDALEDAIRGGRIRTAPPRNDESKRVPSKQVVSAPIPSTKVSRVAKSKAIPPEFASLSLLDLLREKPNRFSGR